MMMSFLVVCILATIALSYNVPEFTAALSFKELGNLKTKVLEPLAQQFLQNISLPVDVKYQKKLGILGLLQVEVNNVVVNQVNINWENTLLTPYDGSTDTIQLQLQEVDISVDLTLTVKLRKFKLLNTVITIKINGLDVGLVVQFGPAPSTPQNWGFTPVLVSSTVDVNQIRVDIHKSCIPKWLINDVLDGLTPYLGPQVSKYITNNLGPSIAELASSEDIVFHLGLNQNQAYDIAVSWTQPPSIYYNADGAAFLSLFTNLDFTNSVTGDSTPDFDTGDLPTKLSSNDDLEITLGGNLLSQLVWVAVDAGLVNVVVDQSALANVQGLPIALSTDGLRIIVTDFYNYYGPGKWVYLHIQANDPIQKIYVRGGRILAALSVNIEFWVDKESTADGPKKFADCTACQNAYNTDVQIGASLALKNLNSTAFTANVIFARIFQLKQSAGGVLSIEPSKLTTTLNSLITALLPGIQADLAKGINNPLIGAFGISDVEIVVGDSFITLNGGLDN
ncbi:hypothetical protein pb186bvf_011626 [Paramecium bursaria]